MKEKGFSLLEIVVTVTVMAILAIMVVPAVSVHSQEAKKARVEQDLHNIALDIQQYALKNQGYGPENLETLENVMGKRYPNDPFTGEKYVLESYVMENGEEGVRLFSPMNEAGDFFVFIPVKKESVKNTFPTGGHKISGIVIDHETKAPVSGLVVCIKSGFQETGNCPWLEKTITDVNGFFNLELSESQISSLTEEYFVEAPCSYDASSGNRDVLGYETTWGKVARDRGIDWSISFSTDYYKTESSTNLGVLELITY